MVGWQDDPFPFCSRAFTLSRAVAHVKQLVTQWRAAVNMHNKINSIGEGNDAN